MGFFDDLVVEPEPEPPRPVFLDLAPREDAVRDLPPSEYVLPGVVSLAVEAGRSEHTRLMLAGCSVWPDSVTLHFVVFRRRIRREEHVTFGRPDPRGLRVGLVPADGRRVTSLDGEPWPVAGAPGRRMRLRVLQGSGGGFHDEVALWLSALPPEGKLTLVVEWPEAGIPETHTALDASGIRSAATRAVEIWPDLAPPAPADDGGDTCAMRGLIAGPARLVASAPTGRPGPEPEDDRYAPRSDWGGLRYGEGWRDLRLVRARLDAGADPSDGLHDAASHGSAETVAELLSRMPDADVDRRDPGGFTALWEAVCHGNEATARLLLEAGADGWTPQCAGRSPGDLAMTVPALAPLFAGLPGAVEPTPEERALQDEADRLVEVFAGVHTEGLGVAFVAGLDEEEAVRRLGADPADCPVLDLDRHPGPYGTGPGGFDPDDFDEAQQYVGVTGVPGGCVLIQPMGFDVSLAEVLRPLSRSTRACGIYFNPKGGTFGAALADGETVWQGEVALTPGPEVTAEWWLTRCWDWSTHHGPRQIAYACRLAGMRLTDSRPVTGPPRRWVRPVMSEG
ncbi:ankyrin repeat domain-containing protein [Streptomyces lavendulocolor]|uniref:ankyrin repeat domain-containing protein n=1 Tax=Streptomyces lavendulocolor TaxID=67316 RepID=UPI003C2DF1CA